MSPGSRIPAEEELQASRSFSRGAGALQKLLRRSFRCFRGLCCTERGLSCCSRLKRNRDCLVDSGFGCCAFLVCGLLVTGLVRGCEYTTEGPYACAKNDEIFSGVFDWDNFSIRNVEIGGEKFDVNRAWLEERGFLKRAPMNGSGEERNVALPLPLLKRNTVTETQFPGLALNWLRYMPPVDFQEPRLCAVYSYNAILSALYYKASGVGPVNLAKRTASCVSRDTGFRTLTAFLAGVGRAGVGVAPETYEGETCFGASRCHQLVWATRVREARNKYRVGFGRYVTNYANIGAQTAELLKNGPVFVGVQNPGWLALAHKILHDDPKPACNVIDLGALVRQYPAIFRSLSLRGGAHAMVIVGEGVCSDKPFWLVRNSYGEQWGEQGHIRVEKNDFADRLFLGEVAGLSVDDAPLGREGVMLRLKGLTGRSRNWFGRNGFAMFA